MPPGRSQPAGQAPGGQAPGGRAPTGRAQPAGPDDPGAAAAARDALGRRRLLVAAALALALLVQGAYSFVVVPEPYPAVRMPSFAGAPTPRGLFGTTTLDVTVLYADGSRLTPDVAEFLAPVRPSAARDSADHVFAPGGNRRSPRPVDDPAVRAFVAERAAALGGGRTPVAVDFCWRAGSVDARTGRYADMPPCDVMRVAL